MTSTGREIRRVPGGGRVTKWKGRTVSIAPAMLSVSVIALSAGLAGAQTISTPETTPQTFGNVDVTVTATGSVTLIGESSEEAIEIDVADYTSAVLIDGALSYLGGTASGSAAGLWLTGDLSGTITNQGVITLDVADTDSVHLIGIGVDDNVSGTITNAGTITVYGNANTSDASANGIVVGGILSGTIRNDGNIDVEAISGTDSASAWGIYVGDVSGTALIENNGTITARAFTFTSSAEAYGIEVDGDLVADARIVNNGLIDVEAESVTYSAYGYGIYVDGDAAGDITNTGTILAAARGANTTADTMEAYGIYVDDSLSGSITNDGLIGVDVDTLADQDSIVAAGVYVGDVAGTGSITNNATIEVGVKAEGVTDTSTIAGIWVDGAMDGNVTNGGTITVAVDAGAVTSSTLYVYGILSDGTVGGTISNTGTIDVAASASMVGSGVSMEVYGISTKGNDIGGAIINSGTITVAGTIEGTDELDELTVWGIEGGDVLAGGLVSNSGTIDVRATATAMDAANTSMDANAYGIDLGYIYGTLSNGGSITVTASASGSATGSISASAYGMDLGVIDASGMVSNGGSIIVTATASGTSTDSDLDAEAYGIYAGGINGTLTNDGTINVTATASGTSTDESIEASAYGMNLGSIGGTGTVSNGGSINVAATADGWASDDVSAEAYGIDASDVNGSLSNGGSINVTATASGTATNGWVWASAYGMDLGSIGGTGTVSNDGSINVVATASGSGADGVGGSAYGIASWGWSGVDGSLSNDGSINVMASASGTATGGSIWARASGMSMNDINGTVTNDGSIAVLASASGSGATDGSALAFGIETDTVGVAGSVSNTGSIVVSAAASNDHSTATATSLAVGIDIDTLNGTLFNSGLVMASVANGTAAGGDEVYAVRVGGGTGAATFTTESFLAGRLSMANADTTVRSVANTGSVYWTFEDNPAAVMLDESSGVSLYRNGAGNVVATVEPASLAFSGLIAAEAAGLGYGTVTSLMSGMPATGATVMTTKEAAPTTTHLSTNGGSGAFGNGVSVFFQGDYLRQKVDDRAGRKLDFDMGGATAGVVGRFDNGMSYGLTLGGMTSDGSVPSGYGRSDTVDTDGVVLGAYGNVDIGGGTSLTFGASAGLLSNKSTRSMNDNLAPDGIATVNAKYDSNFISPSIELSHAFQSGAMTIRPYAGYRYTYLNVDGYTETGGPAAATFGSRDVRVSDFTIGADVVMAAGSGLLTGSAEILHRDVSDDGANVTLFGMPGSTASAATDFTAVQFGLGYGVPVGSGTMNFGAKAIYGSNGVSGYGLTAAYDVRF